MKLTIQELEIVKAISKTTTYTHFQVANIYKVVGSFDKTITIFKHAALLGTLPEDIIKIIDDFRTPQ